MKSSPSKREWKKPIKNGLMGEFDGFDIESPILLTEFLLDFKEGKIDIQAVYDEIKSRIFSTRADTIREVLEKIKNSPKTFGILDKKGRGGAILIEDLEKIITPKHV